jgi:DNA repair exonuclease SbcCD nuclease subunit
MGMIKLLFLADTHLGFDYPFRPRIQRRRRGEDFFANYHRALEPARKLEVDAIIHGGDLLFRSRVSAQLVDMAFAPLKEIADKGIKVYIVPGNHERSKIPFKILSLHPNIYIFDHPKTFILEKKGVRVALSGFPYFRDNLRAQFPKILQETGWRVHQKDCDGHILCVHHCFEGAKVGPVNYTFRYKEDVIRLKDIPKKFIAVFAGHIHRHQVLVKDLKGIPLSTPVYYPGSIERTSFAEKDEKKGYFIFKLAPNNHNSLSIQEWEFVKLPARPMVKVHISPQGMDEEKFKAYINKSLKSLSPQSIVKLDIQGFIPEGCLPVLRASSLRTLAPKEMNISVRFMQPNSFSRYSVSQPLGNTP